VIILNRYHVDGPDHIVRYYAKVRLEDGSVVELSSATERTDEEWLAVAADYAAAIVEQEQYEVEAEDGEIA